MSGITDSAIVNPMVADVVGALDYRQQKIDADIAKRKQLQYDSLAGKALSSGLIEGSTLWQLAKDHPAGYVTLTKLMGIDPSAGGDAHQVAEDVNIISKYAQEDPQHGLDYVNHLIKTRTELGMNTTKLQELAASGSQDLGKFSRSITALDNVLTPKMTANEQEDNAREDLKAKNNQDNTQWDRDHRNDLNKLQEAQARHLNSMSVDGEAATGLSEEAKQLKAARLLQGEKETTVFGVMTKSPQGRADAQDVTELYTKLLKESGGDANTALNKLNQTVAKGRAALETGRKMGTTGSAVQAAIDMGDLAEKASDMVPRGKFVPMNKLLQYTNKQLSDANLASFHAATTGFVNAWGKGINPTGALTNRAFIEGKALLYDAENQEAYNAAKNKMVEELIIERNAPVKALGHIEEIGFDEKGHDSEKQPQQETAAQKWKRINNGK